MIERSIGICEYGYIVGGGYEGKTKQLDDIVKKEAELLQKYFNRDVEIRFNSDRESGGAWIKDGKKNCSVGLSARLSNSKFLKMSQEQKCSLSYSELKKLLDSPDVIVYETGVSLIDTKNNIPTDSKYILLDSEFRDFASMQEAFEYLKNMVVECI
jgi:hypothetical protein